MKQTSRQKLESIGRDIVALRSSAQALIGDSNRKQVEEFINSFDIEDHPLRDDQQNFLATCGALIICSVIDGKIENMAYLLRALFSFSIDEGWGHVTGE